MTQRYDPLSEDVKRWFRNEGNLAKYREGVEALEDSGVFLVLQRLGVPALINYGADEHIMASQGNWSAGYNTCLDHLKHFIRMFEPKVDAGNALAEPDFCGTANAVARGDLTKEEVK